MTIVIEGLRLYGLILVLSVVVGALFVFYNIREKVRRNRQILLYYMIYFPFAMAGGMFYSMIASGNFGMSKFPGLSSYGGLVGVIVGSIIFERIIPLEGEVIKYSVLSLPLVYGLSKLACFSAGCCAGICYDGPIGLLYPDRANVRQFPVQPLETIVFLLIFAVCYGFRKSAYVSYVTIWIAAAAKFVLEFLRYDHGDKLLNANQVFSIFLVLVSLAVLFVTKLKEKKKLL